MKSLKILIIEDSPNDRFILKKRLTEAYQDQYTFIEASDGEEGLDLYQEGSPDCVLLDYNLPDFDGVEFLKELQEKESNFFLPVIVLTGQGSESVAVKAMKAGAQDYLSKDELESDLLHRTIQTTIKQTAMNREIQENRLQLEKTTDELRKLNASKDKFFSIISHDLRSPLGNIMNLSDYMADEFDNMEIEEIKDWNGMIRESSFSLFKLLENLLQWASLQEGMKCEPAKINLYHMVFECIDLLKNNADEKDIQFINETSKESHVYADLNMINSVFRNLLSNAIKFTPKGGKIQIFSQIQEGNVEISIIDTGVGIPKKDMDKLFSIESKYTNQGTEGELGTGLGLILCKEFIQKNGGEIWVESELGQGTTFKFTLLKTETD